MKLIKNKNKNNQDNQDSKTNKVNKINKVKKANKTNKTINEINKGQSFIIALWVGLFSLGGFSCATRPYRSLSQYEQKAAQWSRYEKTYEGFSNTMQVGITLFHPDLLRSQLQFKGEMYGWDQAMYQEQSIVELQKGTRKTKAFLAFYTPDRRLNQLARTQSPWRIFLDVEGRRIQAEVQKNRVAPIELRTLYSRFTRWHTPYDIEFDIPFEALKGKTFQIQVSGPGGQQSFSFTYPLTEDTHQELPKPGLSQ
jgi:hypothetical protein